MQRRRNNNPVCIRHFTVGSDAINSKRSNVPASIDV